MSLIKALSSSFRTTLRLTEFSGVMTQVQPRRWRMKEHDRRYLISTSPKQDSGTTGERMAPLEIHSRGDEMYPDADTPNRIFNGIPFKEIPICHIKTSKNNTIICVSNHLNQPICFHSCGQEGFKNARKGTNVAAQAAAISAAKKAISKGVHTVRIKVEGIGPGRLSSVKGVEMAGLKIVSVTDSTHVSPFPPRPRKQRRL